jgi:hypothetical protein
MAPPRSEDLPHAAVKGYGEVLDDDEDPTRLFQQNKTLRRARQELTPLHKSSSTLRCQFADFFQA